MDFLQDLATPRNVLLVACLATVIAVVVETIKNEKKPKNRLGAATKKSSERMGKKAAAALVLLALTGYAISVAVGHSPSPVGPWFAGLVKNVQTVKALTNDRQSLLNITDFLNTTVVSLREIQTCNNSGCVDKIIDDTMVFFEYLAGCAKKWKETDQDPRAQELTDLITRLPPAIAAFGGTEKTDEQIQRLVELLGAMVFASLPKDVRNQLPPHFQLGDLEKLVEIAKITQDAYHKMDLIFHMSGEIESKLVFMAHAIGAGEFANSWRTRLQTYGFEMNEASFVIGTLGPNLPGLILSFNALGSHYAEFVCRPGVLTTVGGKTYVGPVECDHWKAPSFVASILFGGEGFIHLFHLAKLYVISSIAYFSPVGALLDMWLTSLHEGYVATGQGHKLTVVTFVKTIIGSLHLVIFCMFWMFFVGNMFAVLLSVIVNALVRFCKITLPTWLPFLSEGELRGLADGCGNHFLANWKPLVALVVVAVACFLAMHKYRLYKKFRYLDPDYEEARSGNLITTDPDYVQRLGEWNAVLKKYSGFSFLNTGLIALSWVQPALGFFAPSVASWLGYLPQIGDLNLIDGGISYVWALLDVVSLPLSFLKV